MDEKNSSAAYIYAGITVFLWASAFPGVKYALNWYSPGSLMLFRFIVASASLLVIAVAKKARLPAKEDIPITISGGLIGIFVYMLLFNTGTGMVKTGVSSFIVATSPIFTLILSVVFLKEKPRPSVIGGVLISAFGLVVIAVSQVRELSFNYGIVLLLAASVCTSFYNIIQRRISFKYTPIECAAYSIIPATGMMFIFLPGLVRDFASAPFSADAAIVYMGIFPAALAYLLWNYALGKANSVSSVTNFLYLVPFIATTLSFLILDESLSLVALAGGVTIIAGMVFAGRTPKPQKAAVSE